mgnify:CR=1 FL=1
MRSAPTIRWHPSCLLYARGQRSERPQCGEERGELRPKQGIEEAQRRATTMFRDWVDAAGRRRGCLLNRAKRNGRMRSIPLRSITAVDRATTQSVVCRVPSPPQFVGIHLGSPVQGELSPEVTEGLSFEPHNPLINHARCGVKKAPVRGAFLSLPVYPSLISFSRNLIVVMFFLVAGYFSARASAETEPVGLYQENCLKYFR